MARNFCRLSKLWFHSHCPNYELWRCVRTQAKKINQPKLPGEKLSDLHKWLEKNTLQLIKKKIKSANFAPLRQRLYLFLGGMEQRHRWKNAIVFLSNEALLNVDNSKKWEVKVCLEKNICFFCWNPGIRLCPSVYQKKKREEGRMCFFLPQKNAHFIVARILHQSNSKRCIMNSKRRKFVWIV